MATTLDSKQHAANHTVDLELQQKMRETRNEGLIEIWGGVHPAARGRLHSKLAIKSLLTIPSYTIQQQQRFSASTCMSTTPAVTRYHMHHHVPTDSQTVTISGVITIKSTAVLNLLGTVTKKLFTWFIN